jgi:hypothetical protein
MATIFHNPSPYEHGGSGVRLMNRWSIRTVKSPIVIKPSGLKYG